jgi:hypothetical protein
MIEVTITHVGSGVELGRVTIENVQMNDDGSADYSVRFGVDRHDAFGVHQRGIFGFPRKRYNAFGLLLQALNTLDPGELELEAEADIDGSSNTTHPSIKRLVGRRHRKEDGD